MEDNTTSTVDLTKQSVNLSKDEPNEEQETLEKLGKLAEELTEEASDEAKKSDKVTLSTTTVFVLSFVAVILVMLLIFNFCTIDVLRIQLDQQYTKVDNLNNTITELQEELEEQKAKTIEQQELINIMEKNQQEILNSHDEIMSKLEDIMIETKKRPSLSINNSVGRYFSEGD